MRAPGLDPLASRTGRLLSFFLLYVSEGLPSGFTVTAVGTQMRRLGIGPAEIGAYVGALYLPWAFKWAVGPLVDTFAPQRFGPRRFWIVATQALMVVSLLAAMPIDLRGHLAAFSAVLLLHNVFAATQDVSIDALACNVLPADERGVANGFMFAGQAVGQALGGGGVLFLTSQMPFKATFVLVAGAIAVIGVFVSWRVRDPEAPADDPAPVAGARAAARRLTAFVHEAWRAFTGTRAARWGVLLAALPMGAMALGLALQSNVAVELGMGDGAIGALSVASQLTGAVGCVVGGWLSDRMGRRRSVALFTALMSVPTVVLAVAMARAGVVLPAEAAAHAAPAGLVATFWAACIGYYVGQGLMYGASTALYMDITTPKVAATQFTAYMALSNLAIALSSMWQGHAVERFGYPLTLGLDAIVGVVCLLVLPFVAAPAGATATHGLAPPSGPGPGAAIPEGVVR